VLVAVEAVGTWAAEDLFLIVIFSSVERLTISTGCGGERGRGGEICFDTECGDSSGGVGVAVGCRRYIRCGRVMGGVILGGEHGVIGGRGGIGVEGYSHIIF